MKRLEQAEQHVVEGAACIRRQRKLLAKLVRDGHTVMAGEAACLLRQFENTKAVFIADRDRYLEELAEKRGREVDFGTTVRNW